MPSQKQPEFHNAKRIQLDASDIIRVQGKQPNIAQIQTRGDNSCMRLIEQGNDTRLHSNCASYLILFEHKFDSGQAEEPKVK